MRDQVEKGMGYPVALTEAHRQAVVSEADRQSILQLLEHSSFHGVRTAKMLRKIIVPV
jgi:NurA-like 5'-3' nuclease